jgi:iron-sulfur cluster insertion protein
MVDLVITEQATSKLKELLNQHGKEGETYLRVYVTGGGCSGFSYGMALDNKVQDGDDVVHNNGIKIVVDPNSAQYLAGSKIDYAESVAGAGFVISNPNNWSTCGCGQSFAPKGEEAPDEGAAHHH